MPCFSLPEAEKRKQDRKENSPGNHFVIPRASLYSHFFFRKNQRETTTMRTLTPMTTG